eukprot:GHVS01068896.1.p1 GENE.GHVS01068896.1~~GHVS01068896.1.p1  ORF type:complete len:115 (-),score=5.34 GHVS01068896.1:36-380(-)
MNGQPKGVSPEQQAHSPRPRLLCHYSRHLMHMMKLCSVHRPTQAMRQQEVASNQTASRPTVEFNGRSRHALADTVALHATRQRESMHKGEVVTHVGGLGRVTQHRAVLCTQMVP